MLAMKDVIQMTLKSIHDSLFRLTYILDPAIFASDEIDKVVEPAGISLGDNVGGTSGSTEGPPTKVQHLQFLFLQILVGLIVGPEVTPICG